MEKVEVVVAHDERATLRVGEVFLKIDADQARTDIEVAAMELAPLPTAAVLWRKPPVLALARVPGTALGRLGHPSNPSAAAWRAAGAALRTLHDAPLPGWTTLRADEQAANLRRECAWHDVVPKDLVIANQELAQQALRPWQPVFMHGDLQLSHVFVTDDEVTGVIDWSEGGQGDAMYDLAILTLGDRDRLDDVLAGYGRDVDRAAIRGWWSLRSLTAIRWLTEHGFDPAAPGCEIDVLRRQVEPSIA